MKLKLIFLFLIIAGTPGETDWKHVFLNNRFAETHREKDIPKNVLKAIGVNGYGKIAERGEPWNPGCTGIPGIARTKLDWAAHDDKGHWVLATTWGGWGVHSDIDLVSMENDSAQVTRLSATATDSSFTAFRKSYLMSKE